jgi:hypothetical protein
MSKHVGEMRAKDAKMLHVGAFVEGKLYLSWMHSFQAHSCLLFFFILFYSFIYYCFFVQELIRGHCPSVVTSGDKLTTLPTNAFTEMRRLARDETPFPLAMQPRVTALAW